jgi:glycine/D-amino acid oxidase-like deaminating enzyme/nitrite reductase/ring-hydroxylating ferredoxin subunit
MRRVFNLEAQKVLSGYLKCLKKNHQVIFHYLSNVLYADFSKQYTLDFLKGGMRFENVDKTYVEMINRDGYNVSLWQSVTSPYQCKHIVAPAKSYDVIIAGGGITGVSTALLLQQAGKRCLLIEANSLAFGTTGGTTAHLNTLLDTPYSTVAKNFGKENARLVAGAAIEALELIHSHVERYGISCGFCQADAYLFAQDEKQVKELDEIVEATIDAGIAMSYEATIPVPMSFIKAAKAGDQAKFIPTAYLHGIAHAFESIGGVILQHHSVRSINETEEVTVTTDDDTFTATDFIYATHIPPGINLLHLRCIPYRSYALAARLRNEAYPHDLAYDMVDPYHYYRTQEIDGELYLIAGGEDHKTAHEDNTEKCFLRLESHLRNHFDIAEITHKWSSQYFEPADGLPYIGHLPGTGGHIYTATGFGGNGMTYSGIAAVTLTKMITGQKTPYQKLFDPSRIKPIAGFTQFVQHNAATVKQFLGKLLPSEKLEELADLAPNEGKVVHYDGQKIALYKDEHHLLHAVNPTCTHLKCDVSWNTTERSWDCPCHGARYDPEGKVLTGPADRDLEKIEID